MLRSRGRLDCGLAGARAGCFAGPLLRRHYPDRNRTESLFYRNSSFFGMFLGMLRPCATHQLANNLQAVDAQIVGVPCAMFLPGMRNFRAWGCAESVHGSARYLPISSHVRVGCLCSVAGAGEARLGSLDPKGKLVPVLSVLGGSFGMGRVWELSWGVDPFR